MAKVNISKTTEIAPFEEMASDILMGKVKASYLYDRNYTIIVRDNITYGLSKEIPLGVIFGKNLICNGDDDVNFHFNIEVGFDRFPTVSFRCLSRFLSKTGKANPLLAAKYIANGKIEVVDFTADQTVISEKRPGLGFTLLSSHNKNWHRAASVLFVYDGRMIIMGQDEGSYFGSEIVYDESIKTVTQAFKALMPKHLWRKKGVKRQGEWFFVPVKEKNIPAAHKCLCLDSYIWLTRDDAESAMHTISSDDIRIFENKVFAFDPDMEHSEGDHASIQFEGWCTFERNTAIRSYSEQGVD